MAFNSNVAPQGARFGLRLQLMTALGFMMLLVAVLAFSTLRGLGEIEDSVHQAIAVDGHLSVLANQVSINTLQTRRYEKDLFLNIGNAEQLAQYRTQWQAADQALGQAIDDFAQAAALDADKQQAAQWRTEKTQYDSGFSQVLNGLTGGTIKTPQAANEAFTPFKDGIRALTETAVSTAAAKSEQARKAETDLIASNDRIEQQSWIIVIAALLIGGAWLLLFPARVIRPIIDLQQATGRLAAGDLDATLKTNRRDELGLLAGSFNQMVASLRAGKESEARAREVDIERELRRAEVENRETVEQTVAEYLRFVQQVARGDLAGRVAVTQNGALGQLGSGLNEMVGDLQKITGQVQQASGNIASMAAEILAATTQQAASANEQSAAISQTTTTIEEIKAIAKQTAQQATQVARDSQNALQVARQGTQAVEETVSGMGQIRQRVESIAQTILGLAEQTQTISDIITTVNQLSDQSNLLALNAAIEAARAGEQGKSFAVVAQHVRDLAERSKAATAQVREILGEIQRATNNAVLVTDEGTKGVEVGAKLANEAGQVIHRIAAEVEVGAQSNVQMAAAAQQQTAGMDQIGQAMIAIQQATTQALASTRQTDQAAQELHSLARSLQQAIALYRL